MTKIQMLNTLTSQLKYLKVQNIIKLTEIKKVSKEVFKRSYWNKTNFIEAISFAIKLMIIIPGLLFGKQWWWLYVFALLSSLFLIVTSTIKTLPTILYFNIAWSILAAVSIAKHFLS